MEKKAGLICILIFGLMSLCFAQEVSKWTDTVIKFFEQQWQPGNPSYQTWKDGCKEQFKLDLQKMEFKLEIVEEVTREEDVFVRVIIEYHALCLDEVGLKKRLHTIREVAFQIRNEKIIGGMILRVIKDLTILDGWNLKDI